MSDLEATPRETPGGDQPPEPVRAKRVRKPKTVAAETPGESVAAATEVTATPKPRAPRRKAVDALEPVEPMALPAPIPPAAAAAVSLGAGESAAAEIVAAAARIRAPRRRVGGAAVSAGTDDSSAGTSADTGEPSAAPSTDSGVDPVPATRSRTRAARPVAPAVESSSSNEGELTPARATAEGAGRAAVDRGDAQDGGQPGERGEPGEGGEGGEGGERTGRTRRRRRGGRGRGARSQGDETGGAVDAADGSDGGVNPELPDPPGEGIPRSRDGDGGREAASRRPRIGDTRPAPPGEGGAIEPAAKVGEGEGKRRRRRGSRGKTRTGAGASPVAAASAAGTGARPVPIEQMVDFEPVEVDEQTLKRRRGKERKGRPVGRYLMAVHVSPKATHIAVLEGRNLVEHYVSRPSDDVTQIHGNIYLGRVQNVLPGMEAAFVDIGTPKNAVLYKGDVQFDKDDVEDRNVHNTRIEQVLRPRQTILCQVTKNPIAHKGARLTQEVSLPGRFVVLIPNSTTYGISKRLPDNERRRLRSILDGVRPAQHGVIVRTAAENVTEEELSRDVQRLVSQWDAIDALAKKAKAPALLYREPDLAVRVIREEFNADYRSIVIDDRQLFDDIHDYVRSISPAMADRVEYFDRQAEPLPLFERYHVHEQLVRATEKKVWLPSGGSLIIEHAEALTVIDVNTGKNVGSRNLEDTVFHNNVEAAEEIARQLRLRDVGGIIVIDFVDMEIRANRDAVVRTFRDALSRDKTRTQVFDISELGLVEMTRKRIGEGLLESVSTPCTCCDRRGVVLDPDLVGEHMQ